MTHCTTADKLVIPNFSLAGSVLSRNGGLATFVHEQLEWSLVDQSPEQSEIEWLCVDVAGYKFINVYKPPRSRYAPTAIPTFLVCMLVTSTANMSTAGITTKPLLKLRALTPGQHPTTLDCCMAQRKQSVSPLRWNVGTNPDLAFASFGQDSRLPNRRVLGTFPWSLHRP